MRFFAVFNQHRVSHTLGFNSLLEALDFLFWGYEDQQLLPYGIYDETIDQVLVYTHEGQVIHPITEAVIYTTAKRHLAMTNPVNCQLKIDSPAN